jgi:hypothetical protein
MLTCCQRSREKDVLPGGSTPVYYEDHWIEKDDSRYSGMVRLEHRHFHRKDAARRCYTHGRSTTESPYFQFPDERKDKWLCEDERGDPGRDKSCKRYVSWFTCF